MKHDGDESEMIRVAICEKKKDIREYTKAALEVIDEELQIVEFSNLDDLRENMDSQWTSFDMVLLDTSIQKKCDGLSFAAKLRSKNKSAAIIFITESKAYYAEAFRVFALGYLVYPFDAKELQNCIYFFNHKAYVERRSTWMIKEKGANWCRIYCRSIIYIESHNRDIIIYLEDGTQKHSRIKLNDAETRLADYNFLRCHQSYIVNLYFVDEMFNNSFRIRSREIPISRKYQKQVKDAYYNYMFSKI